MTCYALAMSRLLTTIVVAFGGPGPPRSELVERGYAALFVIGILVIAPVLESLILIGIIEVLRKLRSPVWLQITLAAIMTAAPHWPLSNALVVSPSWFIMAAAYVRWRRVSWKVGFVVVASIHALLNLGGAIWAIGYTIRQATG